MSHSFCLFIPFFPPATLTPSIFWQVRVFIHKELCPFIDHFPEAFREMLQPKAVFTEDLILFQGPTKVEEELLVIYPWRIHIYQYSGATEHDVSEILCSSSFRIQFAIPFDRRHTFFYFTILVYMLLMNSIAFNNHKALPFNITSCNFSPRQNNW